MSHRWTRADDVDLHEVDDGFVVYQPSRDRVHYLNHTAAIVLEFCTGEHDTDAIASMLQAAYELGQAPLAETTECIEQLQSEGLIT